MCLKSRHVERSYAKRRRHRLREYEFEPASRPPEPFGGCMSKMRVYEVARDLAMDNKSLVALFQSVGVTDVRNHMSAVLPEQVDRVKRHLERQSGQKAAEERIHPTVVKRRARPGAEGGSEAPPSIEREEAPAPSVMRR